MSTGRKKLVILSAVFLLAFAIGMMRAPAERTQAEEGGSAMTAASLPVLCTSFGDRLINPLYGYIRFGLGFRFMLRFGFRLQHGDLVKSLENLAADGAF